MISNLEFNQACTNIQTYSVVLLYDGYDKVSVYGKISRLYCTNCMFQVDDNKKLGEWAGLCKIDKDGKARKVVGCSCVVVKVRSSIWPSVSKLQSNFTFQSP